MQAVTCDIYRNIHTENTEDCILATCFLAELHSCKSVQILKSNEKYITQSLEKQTAFRGLFH